jgi:hypothetical protein
MPVVPERILYRGRDIDVKEKMKKVRKEAYQGGWQRCKCGPTRSWAALSGLAPLG